MTTPANPLRALRTALRTLHKELLDAERLEYERSFGRIGSDFYLLQLAAEDPQFAWLRALAGVMLDTDALVARNEPLTGAEHRLLATRIRSLLLADDRMTPFQHRYQRALQEHPAVIMAHSAIMRLLPPATPIRVYKGKTSADVREYGDMSVHMHFPGELIPGHRDHGYGPLALVAESFLPPNTIVPLHEHRNDEIVSWVPAGVMRHEDPLHGKLEIDPGHLLVMNAGKGISHAERTLETEPPLRMLQIFARPHAINLEPHIQHGELPPLVPNQWRHIAGPEGETAPFSLRNDVEIHDVRLNAGERIALPERQGWDAWLFVFDGTVEVDGMPLMTSEHALVQASARTASVLAVDASVLIAFLINPAARVVRAGTIGR